MLHEKDRESEIVELLLREVFHSQDPYVRLLYKMFGHELRKHQQNFSGLLYFLQQGDVPLPIGEHDIGKFFVSAIDEAIQRLPEREQKIIHLYFGFFGDPQTLDQIVLGIGLTRERIRQLQQRALSHMKRFCRNKLGHVFVCMFSDFPVVVESLEREVSKLKSELVEQKAELTVLRGLVKKIKVHPELDQISEPENSQTRALLEIPVLELNVSVRCYNCLRIIGSGLLIDIVQMTGEELLERRNFGKKSLRELKDELERLGLKLGMDVTQYYVHYDS